MNRIIKKDVFLCSTRIIIHNILARIAHLLGFKKVRLYKQSVLYPYGENISTTTSTSSSSSTSTSSTSSLLHEEDEFKLNKKEKKEKK